MRLSGTVALVTGAQQGIGRAMALALAPHRIRVNAIAPGLTNTQQPRYGNTEEQLAVRAREIPLGRMAQPEEIASGAHEPFYALAAPTGRRVREKA